MLKSNKSILLQTIDGRRIWTTKHDLELIGSDINIQNHYGITLLMHFYLFKNFEMCQYLLQNGANINITTNLGNTVLIIACQLSWSSINDKYIRLFIDNKIDTNIQNNYGKTALMFFVSNPTINHKCHDILIELILVSNVAIEDSDGKTAYDYYMEWQNNKNILCDDEIYLLYCKNNTKSARKI